MLEQSKQLNNMIYKLRPLPIKPYSSGPLPKIVM